MRERQHDRHVGARYRCMPFAVTVDVVAQWRERHDPAAAITEAAQGVSCRMCRGATVIEASVLQGQPAEADQ
jgi:hypothetical protein